MQDVFTYSSAELKTIFPCQAYGRICDAVDKDRQQGSNDNFLLTIRRAPGYFLFLWYCVLLIRRRHNERLHESPAPAVLPGTGIS